MNMAVVTDKFIQKSMVSEGRRGDRSPLRILLSSAGRRVGLLRAFRGSAEALGADIEIYACDMQPEWSSACLEADYAFAVPAATSPQFIDTVLDFCKRNAIVLVVPTIDTELLPYSQARARFAEIGTTIAVGDADIIAMARDKLATAQFLSQAGIPSPRTATLEDFLANVEDWTFPVLAKPRSGSSSRGIRVAKSREDVEDLREGEAYVIQEMLCGKEFTVNLFFDDQSNLCAAVPHERLKVRAGEVEKAVTVREATLCRIARDLGAALDRPYGAMCFQAFADERGHISVFEINARFGGGYPLAHRAGAPFVKWLMEERLNLPRSACDEWQAAVVMLRFDDAVFV